VMMKVSIEIHPFGAEDEKYSIHHIYIANKGNGESEFHKTPYDVWFDDDPRGKKPRPKPLCRVEHWRNEGALKLTELVCAEVLSALTGVKKSEAT
jgi:hypothetical protein